MSRAWFPILVWFVAAGCDGGDGRVVDADTGAPPDAAVDLGDPKDLARADEGLSVPDAAADVGVDIPPDLPPVAEGFATLVGEDMQVVAAYSDAVQVTIAGGFRGQLTLAPGTSAEVRIESRGERDIFFARFSPEAQPLGLEHWGGTGDDGLVSPRAAWFTDSM